jgi:hypothetical protein
VRQLVKTTPKRTKKRRSPTCEACGKRFLGPKDGDNWSDYAPSKLNPRVCWSCNSEENHLSGAHVLVPNPNGQSTDYVATENLRDGWSARLLMRGAVVATTSGHATESRAMFALVDAAVTLTNCLERAADAVAKEEEKREKSEEE